MSAAALGPGDPVTVGPFTLDGQLGEGGMGRVYLGTHTGTGDRVAIKVIRPELAADHGLRARFRREVELARQVPAGISADVVDADPDPGPGGAPWVATRYVPGPTLADRVRTGGALPAREVLELADGLLRGLEAVHGVGLVHRDLKPSNVLLGPDGPVIIDFGIARAVDGTRLTATGSVLGTPGYMSPEQALGERRIGPESDVFSLAGVLVFAATGHGPFPAPSTPAVLFRILHGEPDLTGLPAPLPDVVLPCLSRDPAARPPAAALRRLVRSRRTVRRRQVLLGAGGLVVAGGVTAVAGLRPRPADPVPAAPPGPPDRPPRVAGPAVGLGHKAGPIAVTGDRIYIGDHSAAGVTVLDPAGVVLGRIDTGQFPAAMAAAPDGATLYVALAASPTPVLAVETTTPAVRGRVEIAQAEADPAIRRAVELSATGSALLVLDPRSHRILALDPDTLATRTEQVLAGDPVALATGPDGRPWIAEAGDAAVGGAGTVTALAPSTLRPDVTAAGPFPADLAVTLDGARVLVAASVFGVSDSALYVLDAVTGGRVPFGADLPTITRIVPAPNGRWVYLAAPEPGQIIALDATSLTVATTIPAPGVQDLAVAPDGRTLYVTTPDTLVIIGG